MSTSALLMQLRTGVCTFMGWPQVLDSQTVESHVQGVVLGAPFDGGVIHRPGARLGPWALRAASMGLGHSPMPFALRRGRGVEVPVAVDGWVDGGNLPTLPFSTSEALQVVQENIYQWSQRCRTLMLGGDHLATLGALEAHHRRHGALGLLVLDAHPDAAHPQLWGGALHHGTWLRLAIEKGLVEPRRTVQLGLRAPRHETEELAFLAHAGVRMWTPWDIHDRELRPLLQADVASVGQGPAYVSVDLDVLDPAHCPAVAEPVPGGVTPFDVMQLLHLIHQWPSPWVGADVMELAPELEGGSASARVAVHLALHLLAQGATPCPSSN